MRNLSFALAAVILLLTFTHSAAEPITFDAIKGYLVQMKIPISQTDKNSIEFKAGFPDTSPRTFMLRVDEKNKYVYLALVNLAIVKASDPAFCQTAKKMLNYNYGLALSKLEWEESSGEVRLSSSFAAEHGLAKRELAEAIQSLLTSAEKIGPELASHS